MMTGAPGILMVFTTHLGLYLKMGYNLAITTNSNLHTIYTFGGLFNSTVSCQRQAASDGRMADKLYRILLYWNLPGWTEENPRRTSGVPAKIQTNHLLNTSHDQSLLDE
jgi:hypothetical protein